MSIRIVKAGILDSIQDAGRTGYQHLGINPSGVMDRYAMRVANALVGNDPEEAVLEMHFPASVFLFTKPCLIAISGADFSASINGDPVPHLHPLLMGKNDVLQFHKPVTGARAYLSLAGGFQIAEWLGSRSTHLKAKAGGFEGRILQKDDELLCRTGLNDRLKQDEFKILPWQADTGFGDTQKEINVLPGNEWGRLSTGSKESFTMTSFVITRQSDRMGYRLNNIPMPVLINEEVISAAVSFGTIQLLPDGKLIILMADHQTTGGYPRIAHVISAHHTRLAQLQPGDKIRFRFTSQAKAEELYIKQQQHLQQLQNACKFRLEEYFHESNH